MRIAIPIILLASATFSFAGGRIAVIGKDAIDFGKYPAREKKVATYTLRNVGDETVKILKIRKTCGCASATASKSELKPNEETQVEITILPHSIHGPFSKNTFVETTDPAIRFLKLNTAGNAIPLVEVNPSMAFNAGRIKENTEWKTELSLTATEPDVVLGEPVMTNSHPMTVELKRISTNTPASYAIGLILAPTDAPGDLKCSIAVPVITPSNEPPVNITVSGRIGTELSITPGTAYLTLSDAPQTRKFTLRVLGQRSRILSPEELVLPDHKQISSKVTYNATHNTLEAELTFSPEFVKELYAEEKIPLIFSMRSTASTSLLCRISP